MAKEFKITSIRLAELEEELHYLKTTREKEVAEHLKEARSFGDLSENSEYDEAKSEQGKLYSKIAEYQDLVENAIIIEKAASGHAVVLGSRVSLRLMDDNEEETYEIVGSQEANPMQGRISDESPLGRSLMGHVQGDEIAYEAPVGILRYVIEKIEN